MTIFEIVTAAKRNLEREGASGVKTWNSEIKFT
jgi:hypothetical protein